MKNQFKSFVFVCVLALASLGAGAQTTEGRDFWLTFLRGDAAATTDLTLNISSRSQGMVTITNPNQGQPIQVPVVPGQIARVKVNSLGCYSTTSEQVLHTSLHVTSTVDISVVASNYKSKSFDATNLLPTSALLDDYLIQAVPPSDHEDKNQGSHFAIVAVENNTVVDITLTAASRNASDSGVGHAAGATFATPTLQQGDVYYIWTGKGEGDAYDLSGTQVRARNGKRIAVFQGNPHTNFPYQVRDRDHLFSQAMPTGYWGTQFGITASLSRKRDIIRVMAKNDGTEVYLNGDHDNPVYTFDFATNPKRTWEFEIGSTIAGLAAPLVADSSCFLETSCPAAVHLFMVSNRYDFPSGSNPGDPAMVWVSPIEQKISEVTFATFSSAVGHYVNIITDAYSRPTTTLDGTNIASRFMPLTGSNNKYYYARIPVSDAPHTIRSQGGFVGHAYGYGDKESYGYSVGSSATKTSLIINGKILDDDSVSGRRFCIGDTLHFEAKYDVNVDNITWDMGDGVSFTSAAERFSYVYESPGWVDVYALANSINPCDGTQYSDTIHVAFRIGTPDIHHHRFFVCDGESVTYAGKTYTESALDSIAYDCDSLVYVHVEVGHKDNIVLDTVAYDEFQLGSKTYYTSGTYSDTLVNMVGCDSVVTANVTIITCLEIELEQTAFMVGCGGEQEFFVPYHIKKGSFSEATFVCGAISVPLTDAGNGWNVPLTGLKPGRYTGEIHLQDMYCEGEVVLTFSIEYRFPNTIFEQKWEDVLAVLNRNYNGGYDIVAYQWYLDGMPIAGATSSVYYTGPEDTLKDGGSYSVLLTTRDGLQLLSCPKIIDLGGKANAPADTKSVILLAPGVLMLEVDGQQYMIR